MYEDTSSRPGNLALMGYLIVRLTRWEVTITLAPLSMRNLRVGTAALIRVSSVIVPSLRGTLRSALTNTLLPRSSPVVRSPTDFLTSTMTRPRLRMGTATDYCTERRLIWVVLNEVARGADILQPCTLIAGEALEARPAVKAIIVTMKNEKNLQRVLRNYTKHTTHNVFD